MKFTTAAATLVFLGQLSSEVLGNCLDFVNLKAYRTHTCFRGAFTCMGNVDENCHIGENQFLIDVFGEGSQSEQVVGIKFENEGPQNSMIETIFIEDDFNLLQNYYPPTPLNNHGGSKFKVVSNSTLFNAASAHGIEFDQHFVISEVDTGNKLRSRLQSDKSDGIWNSGHSAKHDSVTINFNTECSAGEIETAIEYGLLRIGIQASHFDKKPKHKSYVSCWERLRVIYDEDLTETKDQIEEK